MRNELNYSALVNGILSIPENKGLINYVLQKSIGFCFYILEYKFVFQSRRCWEDFMVRDPPKIYFVSMLNAPVTKCKRN